MSAIFSQDSTILAAMREVEKLTRERAAQICDTWAGHVRKTDFIEQAIAVEHRATDIRELAPLTDAELTEIWERSQ